MTELFDLTGKIAIVTGGGGGIGGALAKGLARHGADVVVTSRNMENLEPVAEEIRSLGKRSFAITSDVTSEKSVADMVDKVVKEYARIDILVNSAGVAIRSSAEEISIDDFRKVMEFNAIGTFICCQAVGRVMIKQNGGRIINLSSIRGIYGAPGGMAYGPSKSAVDAITRNLAVEWGKYNICVNGIAPNLILTALTKSLLTPEKIKAMTATIPLHRMAETKEMVGAVIFLASEASAFMTGQTLHLDGGMTAGTV